MSPWMGSRAMPTPSTSRFGGAGFGLGLMITKAPSASFALNSSSSQVAFEVCKQSRRGRRHDIAFPILAYRRRHSGHVEMREAWAKRNN